MLTAMRDFFISAVIFFGVLLSPAIGKDADSTPAAQKIKVSLLNWTGHVTHLELYPPVDFSKMPVCQIDAGPPPLSLDDACAVAVALTKKESKTDKVWCVFGQLISVSPEQTPAYGTKSEVYAYLIALDVRDIPGAPTDRSTTFKIVFMNSSTASANVVRKPI
jgi:hypothetical protein